jgi:hypothetical protein
VNLEEIEKRYESAISYPVGPVVGKSLADISILIAEIHRVKNLYSKLYQGIWLCPPDEVEFDDASADESFTEACRQSTLFANKGLIR